MLQKLEEIKAKLEEMEAKGLAVLRDVIEDVEQAIGMHKAATDEPANEAEAETVHVLEADPASGAALTTAGAAGPAGDPEVLAAPSTDPAPAAPGA